MAKDRTNAAEDKPKGYAHSVNIGNAGEHLVMAHLLSKGFQAFMADRGNPAFDISVVHGRRHSLIRVKTTNNASVVWSRKKDGSTFIDLREEGDFVCIADLSRGIEAVEIYLVPTPIVAKAIEESRRYWLSGKKRDGGERKDSTGQRLWLTDLADRHIYEGYRARWAKYREEWWRQLSDPSES